MRKNKKDNLDKIYILSMCIFTGLIAVGTIVTAIATYKLYELALKEIPEIKENLQNLTISRGRCITPHLLVGKVRHNNFPAKNAKVTITNLNTGDEKQLLTNENGEYIENTSSFPNCWIGGDKIELTACVSNKCSTKEIVFLLEGGGTEVHIDISNQLNH